jgi:hypothetical protein
VVPVVRAAGAGATSVERRMGIRTS